MEVRVVVASGELRLAEEGPQGASLWVLEIFCALTWVYVYFRIH